MNARADFTTADTSGIFTVEAQEFEGENGALIVGNGRYDYRVENCFDADIGGCDAPEVTHCELLGVDVGGAMIPPSIISKMIGTLAVAAFEAEAAEAILKR